MAALALLMAASCTNDDNDQVTQQPPHDKGIPFTATISIDKGATTRALAESGTDLVATWAAGEKVALVHNSMVDEMTVTPNGDGTATISGTITGNPADNDDVTVIYPASAAKDDASGNLKDGLLTAQNGLLTGEGSIAEKYDVRKSSGAKLKVVSGTASLKGTVSLANQFAIWKLTLNNYESAPATALNAKKLTIKDGSDNTLAATATLGSAISEFYMAVPAISSKDIKIEAVNGSDTYVLSKSGVTLTASTYYQSTAKLARPLSSAKAPSGYDMMSASPGDVGKVVSADGRLFATTAAATAAGTSGVAMICYVSSVGHGLAVELNSSPGTSDWYNAPATATSGKTAVPGSTEWRLPSNEDWSRMFDGCNIAASSTPGAGAVTSDYTSNRNIESLRTKYNTAAGYSLPVDVYWSSTEYDVDDAWYVYLLSSVAYFDDGYKDDGNYRVLACLAF